MKKLGRRHSLSHVLATSELATPQQHTTTTISSPPFDTSTSSGVTFSDSTTCDSQVDLAKCSIPSQCHRQQGTSDDLRRNLVPVSCYDYRKGPHTHPIICLTSTAIKLQSTSTWLGEAIQPATSICISTTITSVKLCLRPSRLLSWMTDVTASIATTPLADRPIICNIPDSLPPLSPLHRRFGRARFANDLIWRL